MLVHWQPMQRRSIDQACGTTQHVQTRERIVVFANDPESDAIARI
jgi:hypothetical protein